MKYILLNGKIINALDPLFFSNERGFLLGDGFFTTLKYINEKLVFFENHYQRLKFASNIFKIQLLYGQKKLRSDIQKLVQYNHALKEKLAIRITITRGCGKQRGFGFSMFDSPTNLITLTKLPSYAKTLKLKISTFKRSSIQPLCHVKHLGYQAHVLAFHEANTNGADDALMINEFENIVCTTKANIFFIKNSEIFTPCLNDGCLPGITRGKILEKNPEIRVQSIGMNELNSFDSAFVTNSLCNIIPVKEINGHVFDVEHNIIQSLSQLLENHHVS